MQWLTEYGKWIYNLIANGKDARFFKNDWKNTNHAFITIQNLLKDHEYEWDEKYFAVDTIQNMYDSAINGLSLDFGF